jgi:hypothetical protein
MAFDPIRRVVLLFGTDGSTWSWNGTDWAQHAPVESPPSRKGAGMAYDIARRQIVLYGGLGEAGLKGDTWVQYGNSWHRVA